MSVIQIFISGWALLSVIQSAQSQSPKSVALFDKLAAAVSRSESQSLVISLANLMASKEMQRNPRKLRSEIVTLLKDKRVQKTSNGRRKVKVVNLPTGIVKILNAKIPVRTKKQILDNVLSRLSKKKKPAGSKSSVVVDKPEEKVPMREVSVSQGVVEEIPRARDEKSVTFPEPSLPSYGGAVAPETGYLASNIAPSDSGYFGDLPAPDLPSYEGGGGADQGEEISNYIPGSSTASGSSSRSNGSSGSGSSSDGLVGSASSADGNGGDGEEENFGFPKKLGRAGIDFPIFNSENIPSTSFSCEGKVEGGYYADPEAGCQLYHVCYQGNKFSQLCPNGTIFHQGQFACSNWRKVDCSPAALQVGDALVTDFAVEREFVTLNLDVSNPLEELPWRNRDS